MEKRISASLLAADFCHLQAELRRVSGADLLHLDVMDGSYVPNISFGLPIVDAVRRCSQLPLDIHLMIESQSDTLRISQPPSPNSLLFITKLWCTCSVR